MAISPPDSLTFSSHGVGTKVVEKGAEEKVDVPLGSGIEVSEIPKQTEGSTSDRVTVVPMESGTSAPADAKIIAALHDIDGGHGDEEEEVEIIDEAQDDESETLTDIQARKDK